MLAGEGAAEKEMFGGIGFFLRGNVAVGVLRDEGGGVAEREGPAYASPSPSSSAPPTCTLRKCCGSSGGCRWQRPLR